MKKEILFLILAVIIIISIIFIISKIPSTQENTEKEEWESTFGGKGNQEGFFVISTEDEGCIATGYSESDINGDKDIFVVKVDKNGNEEWNLTFGGDEDEDGKSLIQTEGKDYIIVGKTDSYGSGESDVLVLKISKDGKLIWNETFGGEKNDRANSIVKTDDGGYIIVGQSESFGNGEYDVFLIKINSSGVEEWSNTIGGKKDEEGRSIVENNSGGYVIAATTRSYGEGRSDIWIINIDNNGEEQWNKTFGYEGSDLPNHIIKTEDNKFIIVGHSEVNYTNRWTGVILKFDPNGNKIWETIIENETDVGLSSVTQAEGGYVSTGYIGPYGNEQDQILVKIDSNGDKTWTKYISGEYCDGGIWIQKSTDGYFYITGYKDNDGSESYDLWLIRTKLT